MSWTPEPTHLHQQPAHLGAWTVLARTTFAGATLLELLRTLGLAGDYADGTPGWVDWQALPDAATLLSQAGMSSGGVVAALQVAVALSSCDRVSSLDHANTNAVRCALLAMADAL